MDPSAITTQPLPSSEKPTEVNAVINSNGDSHPKEILENLTEVTAVFDEKITEEENKNRRKRPETDCCCVCTPYYTDQSDAFCLYVLCEWICGCFRGIGQCTEDLFEGCASCLTDCCEGEGCCSCDCGDGCGECLTGCLDCCSVCNSD